jgi:hypothetical protein
MNNGCDFWGDTPPRHCPLPPVAFVLFHECAPHRGPECWRRLCAEHLVRFEDRILATLPPDRNPEATSENR